MLFSAYALFFFVLTASVAAVPVSTRIASGGPKPVGTPSKKLLTEEAEYLSSGMWTSEDMLTVISFEVENKRLIIDATGPKLHGMFEVGPVTGEGVTEARKTTEEQATRPRKLEEEAAQKLVGIWNREVDDDKPDSDPGSASGLHIVEPRETGKKAVSDRMKISYENNQLYIEKITDAN